jgi:putative isomerase
MPLDEELGVSTGQKRSLAEIKAIIEHQKREHQARQAVYGDLAEVYNAIQGCLAWATIYEPKQDRVIATISRTWDVDRNFGGYLIAQDLFYHAYLASLDNKDLAYACAVEMIKEKTPAGFVPFAASGAGYASLDKASPPLGTIFILDFYRRHADRWLVQEVFDDLLAWNRWRTDHRQIADGLLAWGSSPFEPIYDHFFELEGVNDSFAANRESGFDNSTMWDGVRFNKAKGLMEYAEVGLTSLHIADCDGLAELAAILGRPAEATEMRARAEACRRDLRTLWDETTGLFLNRHTDTGELNHRLSPSHFFPALTNVPTRAQAERMVAEHFYNPAEFWGEWILPCATRNDPAYQDQYYWRGRIWGPTNLLVYLGLRRYGLPAAQRDLARKSKDLLLKEWLEHGHVHENYNAELGIGCDDQLESEKLYTWGGLLGLPSLIEAGYMDAPENIAGE